MAHIKNFFSNLFRRYNIKQTGKGFSVDINFTPIGNALDRAQLALDNQVWADMQKYMPRKSGVLISQTGVLNQSVAGTGEVYAYDPSLEYGHYQYEGEKYVDPVYRKGGFYSLDYGWWSRPGVSKVPSGEPLFYNNPKAEAHWDDVAYANHEKQWVNVAKKTIKESNL